MLASSLLLLITRSIIVTSNPNHHTTYYSRLLAINMASVRRYEYIVPRSFRLRSELEFAEKGVYGLETKQQAAQRGRDPHQGFISYGLGDLDESGYETQLSKWNGTIIGPQNTPLGDRIYTVKLYCGPRYPDLPPDVTFVNKIAMNGVDAYGRVNYAQVAGRPWQRSNTMYDFLVRIREAMVQAAKTKQPSPDEVYPGN